MITGIIHCHEWCSLGLLESASTHDVNVAAVMVAGISRCECGCSCGIKATQGGAATVLCNCSDGSSVQSEAATMMCSCNDVNVE